MYLCTLFPCSLQSLPAVHLLPLGGQKKTAPLGAAFSDMTKYIHIFQSTGPGSRATETGAPPPFDMLVIS